MKKILFFSLAACLICTSASAQHYYQDAKNSEMLRHSYGEADVRKEIILPQVNGYNVYKADLHTHTVFSDGNVLPAYRVREAWQDGLDIMAVTEHIEHRPHEAIMVEYLDRYTDEKHKKAKNHRGIGYKPLDEDGIMVDLNYSVRLAQKEAKRYGLTIVPGTEITRSGDKIGHFNALFTTDNNKIFDLNPVQAIRNAKAQGAIVMHNHPGWSRTDVDYTNAEKEAYDEGLIDGVEVMNTREFYPKIIDRARERGLFVAANSDIHGTTANEYRMHGQNRPMTLVLAKDKSLESVKEALLQRRTIALAFDNLCGERQLLEDFFRASVNVVKLKGTGNIVMMTNMTDIPYYIQIQGHNPIVIDSRSTVRVNFGKNAKKCEFTVLNMWTGETEHPVIGLK